MINEQLSCDCAEWAKSMPQIRAATVLAWNHGVEYNGEQFRYCPWCGASLENNLLSDSPLTDSPFIYNP